MNKCSEDVLRVRCAGMDRQGHWQTKKLGSHIPHPVPHCYWRYKLTLEYTSNILPYNIKFWLHFQDNLSPPFLVQFPLYLVELPCTQQTHTGGTTANHTNLTRYLVPFPRFTPLPSMKRTAALIKLPAAADPIHNLTNSVDPFHLSSWTPGWEMLFYTTVPHKQIL